jgi:hypothetical protein
MLSKDENELLCRTGPGTPMGRVVPRRRYRVEAPIVERGARSQAGQEPSEPHCGGTYRVHPTASLMRREISFNEVARSAMPIRLDT